MGLRCWELGPGVTEGQTLAFGAEAAKSRSALGFIETHALAGTRTVSSAPTPATGH